MHPNILSQGIACASDCLSIRSRIEPAWPRLVNVTEPNTSPVANNIRSVRLFSSHKLLVPTDVDESEKQSKKRYDNTYSSVGSASRCIVWVMARCRMSVHTKKSHPAISKAYLDRNKCRIWRHSCQ